HYTHTKSGLDVWQKLYAIVPAEDGTPEEAWRELTPVIDQEPTLHEKPASGAQFHELPGYLMQGKVFAQLSKQLKEVLYQQQRVNLWSCAEPTGLSRADETESDFRQRLVQSLREERDVAIEKLRAKYAPKLAALEEKIRKARHKLETE